MSRARAASRGRREQIAVVAIPVAGEEFGGIAGYFLREKFAKTWVRRLYLGTAGPAVVSEVVAASEGNRDVDEGAEGVGGARQSGGRMLAVKIEDDAGPRLARPREQRFVVAFDQADGAIDHGRRAGAEQVGGAAHEFAQRGAWHIKFGDHLAACAWRAESAVEGDVVVVGINAELVGVAPVALALG